VGCLGQGGWHGRLTGGASHGQRSEDQKILKVRHRGQGRSPKVEKHTGFCGKSGGGIKGGRGIGKEGGKETNWGEKRGGG